MAAIETDAPSGLTPGEAYINAHRLLNGGFSGYRKALKRGGSLEEELVSARVVEDERANGGISVEETRIPLDRAVEVDPTPINHDIGYWVSHVAAYAGTPMSAAEIERQTEVIVDLHNRRVG